jgi:uncharacterized membrane protein YeaQ/YmgE (transglycosylase-associated protein family)
VFQIVWILIIGLVLGLLARMLLRGRQAIPLWLTMLLGIVGALLGNAVAGWIGVRHTSGVDWLRHLLQVLFSMLLVGLVSPAWSRRRVGR